MPNANDKQQKLNAEFYALKRRNDELRKELWLDIQEPNGVDVPRIDRSNLYQVVKGLRDANAALSTQIKILRMEDFGLSNRPRKSSKPKS